MPPVRLLVGTFKTPLIYTLSFDPSTSTLSVQRQNPAVGSHSWLALSTSKTHLYATAWTTPPSAVAYSIASDGSATLINNAPVRSRNGYIACSATHIYSVSGPGGEVFKIRPEDGGVGDLVQEISFVEEEKAAAASARGDKAAVQHGDFGGLRHGGHSGDLSPDGHALYVADIGRNCVWVYSINSQSSTQPHLTLGEKHIAQRPTDGPRHTTPHPNGRVLYVLNEHSSTVSSFTLSTPESPTLTHSHDVKIIPEAHHPTLYWADEVRLSKSLLYPSSRAPRFLYASTRGLEANTKGYVAVYALDEQGGIGRCVDMYETATSGGWANAVEPAPEGTAGDGDGREFVALTDSEEGWVFMLAFDGRKIEEVARVRVEEAATAVWL